MDHLIDKEWAGWSHLKSCGQQLNVQVKTSDEWGSLELSTGISAA